MNDWFQPTATYPTTPYGTPSQNVSVVNLQTDQVRPTDPYPTTPYGQSADNNVGPFNATSNTSLVKTAPYPPVSYGTSGDSTGPTTALRGQLVQGQSYPTTPYGASGDTGTPGNLRGALVSGDPYPATPYGSGAQMTNSQPAWPVYTFRLNLKPQQYWDWSQPLRTTTDGNEVTTEEQNFTLAQVASTWLASLFPGVEMIAHHDGDTFTVYGAKAQYLKNTYVTGSPDDVLTIVS